MQLIATDKISIVLGMGLTGMSVARYFCRHNEAFILMDTRTSPPEAAMVEAKILQEHHKVMSIMVGELKQEVLLNAKQIVVSPGVPLSLEPIAAAKAAGIPIVGDIDLFLQQVKKRSKAKVIAVTGSNGKSTVVSMLGLACKSANLNAVVAGNIGVPVLDVLEGDVEALDIIILELSSFQLETLSRGSFDVACVLNISADHMDRYPSIAHYCQAKQRIYFGAKNIVYNTEDLLTIPPVMQSCERFGFSINKPIEENQTPVYVDTIDNHIVVDGNKLFSADEILVKGSHNLSNALAVFAMFYALNLDLMAVENALKTFKGLPHRCETVGSHNGVSYINDSKATNVGSTLAALSGLADFFSRVILIAGGDSKDADFSAFAKEVNALVFAVILIGKDAPFISQALKNNVVSSHAQIYTEESLKAAVVKAKALSLPGDLVLLSPACASLDMFENYEHRGQAFTAFVKEVAYV